MYLQSGMPLLLQLSRTTPNQSPGPIISRTFGYMGLALYESVVPGIPADKSIQSQLNELPAFATGGLRREILLSCLCKCCFGQYGASHVWQYFSGTKFYY